jgi:hypothetical protein
VENEQQLRKCFSSVDNLISSNNDDDLRLLRRYNDLCSEDEAEQRRRSFCGKLEILSTPKNFPDKRKSPPDHIILSKTVRKEKRKQRHKREMSNDRWTCDEDETSPTSPSASKASRVTYMTSHFRDLTVKTPFETAPSDEVIRSRLVTSSVAQHRRELFNFFSFFQILMLV